MNTYIEITGNIQVHQPVGVKPPEWCIQQEAEVIEYQPWFNREWQAIVDRAA